MKGMPQQGQGPVQANVNVDLAKIDNEACNNCGSELWEQNIVLKKVSAIVSPTGKEEIATIPVLSCKRCYTAHPATPVRYDMPEEKSNIIQS